MAVLDSLTVQEADGKTFIGWSQDCTSILEDAKARHVNGLHGSSEMKHAARIPNILIDKYCNDHNITFAEWMSNPHHLKAMLNDPSLSHFRIWPGKV